MYSLLCIIATGLLYFAPDEEQVGLSQKSHSVEAIELTSRVKQSTVTGLFSRKLNQEYVYRAPSPPPPVVVEVKNPFDSLTVKYQGKYREGLVLIAYILFNGTSQEVSIGTGIGSNFVVENITDAFITIKSNETGESRNYNYEPY